MIAPNSAGRTLVRMPNWLGDAVMATPALANLMRHCPDDQVVLVGSAPVAEMFRHDPAFCGVQVDQSRSWRFRPAGLRHLAWSLRREYGPFGRALTFANSLSSALLLRFSGAPQRVGAWRRGRRLLLNHPVVIDRRAHQAERYNALVNAYLGTNYETGPTALCVPVRHRYPRKTVGINAGAAYGSAKRWHPARFAEVAARLSDQYAIVLFGSAQEASLVGQIAAALRQHGVTDVDNLAGRTSIATLLSMLAGLDLLITNDSGPMHIAAALGVPSVAIFGSTNHLETCPWRHPRSVIVRHDLPCAPCMQRRCPLKHHACMEAIEPQEVVDAALSLVARPANQ
ncbi:MAG: lipopolysaccharide heptosyltransferase II [Planctomycetes bacterium RBG_16_64_10]|nr:MAG: lipopolysaccharide heptosyltransferase II [Planctomycetes bacterium RBG_16_64_10]